MQRDMTTTPMAVPIVFLMKSYTQVGAHRFTKVATTRLMS